jgi:hypothetical protein
MMVGERGVAVRTQGALSAELLSAIFAGIDWLQ